MTPPLDRHSPTEPRPEMLLSVSTGNRNLMSWKNACGIVHAHMYVKDYIFRQKRLNHLNIGVGMWKKIIGPIMPNSF